MDAPSHSVRTAHRRQPASRAPRRAKVERAEAAPPSGKGRPALPTRREAISVRTATLDDLGSVVALRLALLREEGVRAGLAPLRRDASSRARRTYALQLANPAEATLLAIDGGTAVGVLRCTIAGEVSPARKTRFAFLTSAYVVPSHRRRGIMRRLLAAADAWCRLRQLSEMRLHVQWENVTGNSAWDALGFDAIEIRRRRVVPER